MQFHFCEDGTASVVEQQRDRHANDGAYWRDVHWLFVGLGGCRMKA